MFDIRSILRRRVSRLPLAVAGLFGLIAGGSVAAQSELTEQYGAPHRFQHLRVFSEPHHLYGGDRFYLNRFHPGASGGSYPRYYNLSTPGPFVIQGTTGYLPNDDHGYVAPRRHEPNYAYTDRPVFPRMTPTPADAGGWAFLTKGRYREAEARFDIALSRRGEFAQAQLGRSIAKLAQQPEKALPAATDTIQHLLKSAPDALARMTLTAPQRQQLARIAAATSDAIDASGNDQSHLTLAVLHYLADQPSEAHNALNVSKLRDTPAAGNLRNLLDPPATQPKTNTTTQ
jgi:hypothetical protein